MTDIANILMGYKTTERRPRQQRPQQQQQHSAPAPRSHQKVVVPIPNIASSEMFPSLQTVQEEVRPTVWNSNVLIDSLRDGKKMGNECLRIYQAKEVINKKEKIVLVDKRVIYGDLLENERLHNQIRNYF